MVTNKARVKGPDNKRTYMPFKELELCPVCREPHIRHSEDTLMVGGQGGERPPLNQKPESLKTEGLLGTMRNKELCSSCTNDVIGIRNTLEAS